MKTHDDDISGLFKAIGSTNNPFVEFGDQANATNAQQRWPLFKTIGLEKRPPPPQLLQDEKEQWEKPAVPVAAFTQPTPPASKSATLSNKIAGGLNKLNHARTAAAPLRRETPPEQSQTRSLQHHAEPQAAPAPNLNAKARAPLLRTNLPANPSANPPANPPSKPSSKPSWFGKPPKTDTPAPDVGSKLFGRLAKAAATEAAPNPVRSSRLFGRSSPPPAPRGALGKSLFGSPAAAAQHENRQGNKQEDKHLSSLFARIQAPEQEPEPAPVAIKKRSFFNRLGKP